MQTKLENCYDKCMNPEFKQLNKVTDTSLTAEQLEFILKKKTDFAVNSFNRQFEIPFDPSQSHHDQLEVYRSYSLESLSLIINNFANSDLIDKKRFLDEVKKTLEQNGLILETKGNEYTVLRPVNNG